MTCSVPSCALCKAPLHETALPKRPRTNAVLISEIVEPDILEAVLSR